MCLDGASIELEVRDAVSGEGGVIKVAPKSLPSTNRLKLAMDWVSMVCVSSGSLK